MRLPPGSSDCTSLGGSAETDDGIGFHLVEKERTEGNRRRVFRPASRHLGCKAGAADFALRKPARKRVHIGQQTGIEMTFAAAHGEVRPHPFQRLAHHEHDLDLREAPRDRADGVAVQIVIAGADVAGEPLALEAEQRRVFLQIARAFRERGRLLQKRKIGIALGRTPAVAVLRQLAPDSVVPIAGLSRDTGWYQIQDSFVRRELLQPILPYNRPDVIAEIGVGFNPLHARVRSGR